VQVPTVINGDAISEVGYILGTSADNYRSAYLEAAILRTAEALCCGSSMCLQRLCAPADSAAVRLAMPTEWLTA
jgi:hypothetical protein